MPRQVAHSMMVDDSRILELHGDLEGQFVLDERLPDGRIVLRPEPSLREELDRLGATPLNADELPDWFHELPTDGEG